MPSKKKKKSPERACTSVAPIEEPSQPSQDVDQFERELHWCIDQLQLGLETQNPDSRKAQEAVKVLKILTSSKAPLIKKRQAMRNTFGDYRKKIEEEEKKSTAVAKKMKLSKVESGPETSKFFRKSSSITHQSTDISNSFQFNFKINDEMTHETNHINVNTKQVVTDKVEKTCEQTSKDNLICKDDLSDSTPFKFARSKNDFKFNFSVTGER